MNKRLKKLLVDVLTTISWAALVLSLVSGVLAVDELISCKYIIFWGFWFLLAVAEVVYINEVM